MPPLIRRLEGGSERPGEGVESVPDTPGERVLFEGEAALGTWVGLGPGLDAVDGGVGALGFEAEPGEGRHGGAGQSAEEGLEGRGSAKGGGLARWFGPERATQAAAEFGGRGGNSEAGDGVVEFVAVEAEDGLDEEVEAAVGAAGDLGAVAAPGAFKPVGSAHAIWVLQRRTGRRLSRKL